MARTRKTTRKATKKKASGSARKKPAKKSAQKSTKKAARKSTKKSTKKVAKKTPRSAKKQTEKASKKAATKKTEARVQRERIARKTVDPGIITGTYAPSPAAMPVQRTELPPTKPDAAQPRSRRPWAIGLVVVVLLGCILYFRTWTCGTVGPQSGTITLPGLAAPAVIRRDSLGIPYIKAADQSDLFYAVGYAMAQDRLWQMNLLKYTAQGRLAELLGPGLLEADLYVRTLGLAASARRALAAMPPSQRVALQRFSEGVNHYMSTQRLPIEFRLAGFKPDKWTPFDSLCVFGMVKLDLSYNLREELSFLKLVQKVGPEKAAYLYPIYPGEKLPLEEVRKLAGLNLSELKISKSAFDITRPTILGDVDFASNNWAISGRRARGGKSIVANDTHLKLSMPSFWLVMNLDAPGYRAGGVMLPGIPLIVLGYNGKVAWGATMVIADNQDLFLEKLRSAAGGKGKQEYLYRGRWFPVKERREVFRIKGAASQTRIIRSTRHGPLLNEAVLAPKKLGFQPAGFKLRYGIALRWSNQDLDRSTTAVYELARAQTTAQVRKALSLLDTIYLNIVYGDKESIGWQTTGRLPRRARGRGLLPSPGWTGEYDWVGYLPYSAQPSASNPASGYLGTANHRITRRPPPYHVSSSWASPERMERVRTMLQAVPRADRKSVQAMHADRKSHLSLKIKHLLLKSPASAGIRAAIGQLKDEDDRKRANQALRLLASFDGIMSPESAGAALVGAFEHHLTRALFADEFAEPGYWKAFLASQMGYSSPQDHLLYRPESPFWDDVRTSGLKETRAQIIAASLAKAYAYCEEEMGSPANWQWGDLHRYHWRHALSGKAWFLGFHLNRGPYAAGGSRHTVNLGGFKWGRDFRVTSIPALRLFVDFSLAEPASILTHSGQSGNPSSAHYATMIPYFLKTRYHPLPFRADNIERQYAQVLRLEPPRKKGK